MSPKSLPHRTVPLGLVVLGAAGCFVESGIAERHIQGIATLPPQTYAEVEEANTLANDTVDTAEAAGLVAYHTRFIDGWLDTVDWTGTGGYSGEIDVFELGAGVPGIQHIELVWDGADYDFRLWIYDATGLELANDTTTVQDGFDFPFFTVELEEEGSVFVAVQGRDAPSEVGPFAYRLIVTHIEPSDEEDPNAANSLNFRSDKVLMGAYLGEDPDALGNPVTGTTAEVWTYDEATFTWWAPFEMWTVQEVTSTADVIIEGRDDGLDNNCDGVVDGGNIRSNQNRFDDVDGDGVTEVDGDCDDNDPTVSPLMTDDWGDRIDNDCSGIADNGPDGVDRDGDGYSVADGDCNDADPSILPSISGEADVCNGIDDDCSGETDSPMAEGAEAPCVEGTGTDAENTRVTQDLDGDGYTPEEGDCNDDPDAGSLIHPDPEAGGEDPSTPAQPYLDWQDFVDNDCDGTVDENYEYMGVEVGEGEQGLVYTFVPNPDYLDLDQDADGYTMAHGDCDDTKDKVGVGQYETTTTWEVNSNIDRVYLYGGTFLDLNNTGTGPGDVVASTVTPLDLDDTSATWTMDQGWDAGTGGRLVPSGLVEVPLDVFVPVTYCSRIEEDPALDRDNDQPDYNPPYDNPLDLGITCGEGLVSRADGEIDSIVADSWDGDTDGYTLTTGVDGYLTVEMDWPVPGADYDFLFFCYYGDEFNPYDYYLMIDSAYTATDNAATPQHEGGTTIIPLTEGTQCWIWAVGYAVEIGPYSLKAYH